MDMSYYHKADYILNLIIIPDTLTCEQHCGILAAGDGTVCNYSHTV